MGDDTFIIQKHFVLAMLSEFRIPSPTMPFEKLLNAYYKACPSNHQGRADKRFVLFTLLALEWKRCILENPFSFFLHCLNLISSDKKGRDDEWNMEDILSILELGQIHQEQRIISQQHFLKLYQRHGTNERRMSTPCIQHRMGHYYVTKSLLKLIFELSPLLLFDFRDNIVQHFDSKDRLQDLARKEVKDCKHRF